MQQFDHHVSDIVTDPWSTYEQLRAECPVAHTDAHGGFWVVSRYDDVRGAALDPATFSSEMDDLLIPPQGGGRLLPVQCDPPATSAYRKLLSPYFSAAHVRGMEPAMRRIVRETLALVAERDEFDVVDDLANVVPGKVTMHLVGWDEDDWADVVLPIRAYSGARPGDSGLDDATEQIVALRHRVDAEIAAARHRADGGLIADLAAADVDGRPLDDDEIVSLFMMVLFGGVDTTVSAIGNALIRLDEDRSLRARLRDDSSLIPAAVDELLRIDSPVTGFARRVTRPCQLAGQELEQGDTAFLLWASANRDPQQFDHPDEIRLDRGPARHLSFGVGQHKCLGATLARVELRILLEEALTAIPDYRIHHDRIRWQPSNGTVYARTSIPATIH